MVHGPLTTYQAGAAYGTRARRASLSCLKLNPATEAARWRAAHADHGGVHDLWQAVRDRGWRVEIRELRADVGGIEGFTVPCEVHGFRICVDDRSSGAIEGEGEQSPVTLFRLAHEVAHTFFYRPGRPPTRPAPPSPEEEAFCDLFADALLGPGFARPSDCHRT
jgi:hypothetical protein